MSNAENSEPKSLTPNSGVACLLHAAAGIDFSMGPLGLAHPRTHTHGPHSTERRMNRRFLLVAPPSPPAEVDPWWVLEGTLIILVGVLSTVGGLIMMSNQWLRRRRVPTYSLLLPAAEANPRDPYQFHAQVLDVCWRVAPRRPQLGSAVRLGGGCGTQRSSSMCQGGRDVWGCPGCEHAVMTADLGLRIRASRASGNSDVCLQYL